MTTIAWDGHTLAADCCAWSAGIRTKVRKVHKLEKYFSVFNEPVLVAFAGDAAFATAILEWLQDGLNKPKAADFGVDPTRQCALVIHKDKTIYQLSATLHFQKMNETMFAMGAGQDIAWGALEAGATAEKAVLIATKRSDYAAFGVDTVSFDQQIQAYSITNILHQ